MSVNRTPIDVSSTAAYPTDPQVVLPFIPISILIINEDDTDDAYLSFDGKEDHAHLAAGVGLSFVQKTTKVWLRRGAVGTAPTTVSVIAES